MSEDPGAIWRDQPEEERTVNLELIVSRRTGQLSSSTRAEILLSIAAALFFVIVMAWRLAPAHDPRLQVGYGAIIAWVAISAYRFRRQIMGGDAARPDAAAATCLDYYRHELERRRDHLRNSWVWQGPLVLACLILLAVLPGTRGVRNALPLLVLLIVWTGYGIVRRHRQAKEIQREIDEL